VKILLLLGSAFVFGAVIWLVSSALSVAGWAALEVLGIMAPYTRAFWILLGVAFFWYGWYFHCLWCFHRWDTKRNQVTDRCVRCGSIRFK